MEQVEAIVKRLDEMFPDKNLLNVTDIAKYTGLSRKPVQKLIGLTGRDYIDKVSLAIKLAK